LLLPDKRTGQATGLVFGGKAGFMYVVDPNGLIGFQRDRDEPAVERIRLSNGIYGCTCILEWTAVLLRQRRLAQGIRGRRWQIREHSLFTNYSAKQSHQKHQ
jgi:hypothetical protein